MRVVASNSLGGELEPLPHGGGKAIESAGAVEITDEEHLGTPRLESFDQAEHRAVATPSHVGERFADRALDRVEIGGSPVFEPLFLGLELARTLISDAQHGGSFTTRGAVLPFGRRERRALLLTW